MRICQFIAVVLLSCFVLSNSAQAAPLQDLDRINNIVDQARNLADSVRQGSDAAATNTSAAYTNPFARAGNAVQTSNSAVQVNDQNIRINAGGLQFDIPRANSPAPSPGQTNTSLVRPRQADLSGIMSDVAVYQNFAAAVQSFRTSQFDLARQQMDQVMQSQKVQPLFHQFNSLVYFAQNDYQKAAAAAYAAVSTSQPWGWEQLKGYYGNQQAYPQQYLNLQTMAQNPNCDVSVRFLLGYHHLMLGHREHAARELQIVLRALPNDNITRGLLAITQQAPPKPIN